MSTDRSDPSLVYTLPYQITDKIHREQIPDVLLPEKSENSAKGKIVLITGGGTGIGAAAARVWVRANADGVIITGRRQEKLDETIRELEKLAKEKKVDTVALAVSADLRVEADVQRVYEEAKKRFDGRTVDVVIANAAWAVNGKPMFDETVSNWWNQFESNVLGLHNTVVNWVRSQKDPKAPTGTIVYVNSGVSGLLLPGTSGYSLSKLAGHRYMEFLAVEYPTLTTYNIMPGIVMTDSSDENFKPFAKDSPELVGAWALYLSNARAAYLQGSLLSVNWDPEELEAHKEEIETGMLKMSWVPALPVSGGSGFKAKSQTA